MILPIIGAFLEAGGTILEKKTLRGKNLDYRNYTVFGFLTIIVVMLPLIYFIWSIDSEFWNLKPMLIFLFIILTALAANLCIFYSLKREKIAEFEPLWLMQPLFVVLLAVTFYESERNWTIFALAIIASLTLIITHIKRHHLQFDRYLVVGLIGSFLFGVELVASKSILGYFSPFTFYFIRCSMIFVFSLALYRPKMSRLDIKLGRNLLIIAVMWVLYRTILYFGYESYGVVYTTIIFILSPVLMLILAAIFLRERPTLRQIMANVIILICVSSAIILNN